MCVYVRVHMVFHVGQGLCVCGRERAMCVRDICEASCVDIDACACVCLCTCVSVHVATGG